MADGGRFAWGRGLLAALLLIATGLLAAPMVLEHATTLRGHAPAGTAPMHVPAREAAPQCHGPTFHRLAFDAGSDKASSSKMTSMKPHKYELAYDTLLPRFRCTATRMAEIGLGCGMPYGAGHSVPIWLKYFKHPDFHFTEMEFQAQCAEDFMRDDPLKIGPELHKRVSMYGGIDQSNVEALIKVGNEQGPWDVIVDDGGHTWKQQITSLITLMPFVKPGGIYFMEDVQTSYGEWVQWCNDWPVSSMDYVQKLQDAMHWPPGDVDRIDDATYPGLKSLLNLVRSVECFREVCAFHAFEEGQWPVHDPPADEPLL